ncbi:hypothetical protein PR002_g2635 [Phytophthora rubi]|uniref:Uncharacterized protein n=1 Tax=Phytophthora rubi TaxID=129364 RepID=A0A6A3NT88_9STRA|nr:hypothetical protein PR002_g2635 [Phytophthora rubi]
MPSLRLQSPSLASPAGPAVAATSAAEWARSESACAAGEAGTGGGVDRAAVAGGEAGGEAATTRTAVAEGEAKSTEAGERIPSARKTAGDAAIDPRSLELPGRREGEARSG